MARYTLFWNVESLPSISSAGVVGDDFAQRLHPGPLALGEILQHVVLHQLLVARMADAHAHAPIVVADMRGDRAQAVVAGIAAACFQSHLAGRQFEPRRETPRRLPPRACRNAPLRPPRVPICSCKCRAAAIEFSRRRSRLRPPRLGIAAAMARCRGAAIACTAMKPILWRLPAYCSPGLPRPTKSSMASPPSRGEIRERGGLIRAPPHFLSDFAGAAAARAARGRSATGAAPGAPQALHREPHLRRRAPRPRQPRQRQRQRRQQPLRRRP